jgi:hypothetical protein
MTMLDDAQTPPLGGQRPLTELERRQRAVAMACFDPAKRPGVADCSQSLSPGVRIVVVSPDSDKRGPGAVKSG